MGWLIRDQRGGKGHKTHQVCLLSVSNEQESEESSALLNILPVQKKKKPSINGHNLYASSTNSFKSQF